jgi:hypothetical protein
MLVHVRYSFLSSFQRNRFAGRLVGLSVLTVSALLSWSAVASAGVAGCPGGGSVRVASYLFDCRAYELVSPAYKEGFQLTVRGVSEDGSRILASSFGSFSDPEDVSAFGGYYEIVRGGTGWEATIRSLDAPFSEFPVYDGAEGISPDFQSSLALAVQTPGQVSVTEVYLRLPGAPPVPVGPLEPPAEPGEGLTPVGASEDLRRVLFVTHSPTHEEKSPLWPGDTTAGGRHPSLYEYEYTGREAKEPRLVGIDNVGVPASVGAGHLISDCGTSLGSSGRSGSGEGDVYNAVSGSGAAVFFKAAASSSCGASGPPVNEVYARLRETPTVPAHAVAISEPSLSVPGRVCTGACREYENEENGHKRSEGLFAGASRDGSTVFFLTRQPLVNGDERGEGVGQDLYEADIGNGVVTRLVQVSRGGRGDPTPGSGAGVLGVVRVSEDGSRVYFVAEGTLTGANREGKTPLPGAPNLYVVARECAGGEATCASPLEHTSFIATLSGADGADWSSADRRPAQATPDGRFLVFQSTADLTPDQEGRVEAGQVFEYDVETETLVRVSRGQGGYNEDGNSSEFSATIPVQEYEREGPLGGDGHFTGLAVSADGSRVFFSSRDALTPQALNGVVNVYEYHAGQVGLISDGHDTVLTQRRPAVELIGTDESGSDVFFTTADHLVPQDTDTQVDIYDARIGGGFALVLPVPCVGDSCQSPPSVSPSLLVPGMSSSAGETSTSGSIQKAPSKKKLGKRRRKAKKGRGKTHRGRKTTGRKR